MVEVEVVGVIVVWGVCVCVCCTQGVEISNGCLRHPPCVVTPTHSPYGTFFFLGWVGRGGVVACVGRTGRFFFETAVIEHLFRLEVVGVKVVGGGTVPKQGP